jgi:hypothetical protein
MNKVLYCGLIVAGILVVFTGYSLGLSGFHGAMLAGSGVFTFFVGWVKLLEL